MNFKTRDALLVATFTAASILTAVTLACRSIHGNYVFPALHLALTTRRLSIARIAVFTLTATWRIRQLTGTINLNHGPDGWMTKTPI
jgi:hypothetical protein